MMKQVNVDQKMIGMMHKSFAINFKYPFNALTLRRNIGIMYLSKLTITIKCHISQKLHFSFTFFSIRDFLTEYKNGGTPNPDINCNKFVKFGAFFDYARKQLNADAIATGHYAQSSFGNFLEYFDKRKSIANAIMLHSKHIKIANKDSKIFSDAKLLRATDTFKDQTLFLSQIKQEALRRTMFPVGTMWKSRVKKIAKEIGLHKMFTKRESRGICFIGKRKFQDFISEYLNENPGDFVDIESGEILEKHNGIHSFAIGQCVRLTNRYREKIFAIRKIVSERTILVAPGSHHPLLYSNLFYTNHPHWISSSPFELNLVVECLFRFQHTHPLRKCKLCQTVDGLFVYLDEPVRSIKIGQFAAFYVGDECLGSAKINNSGPLLIF